MSKRINYRDKIGLMNLPLFRWAIAFLMVLMLSSCGGKVDNDNVSILTPENKPQISQVAKNIAEVPEPKLIQKLRSSLEGYEPQVKILTPFADEVITDDAVEVSFQVNDLPIFKDSQWDLGPHLHVILDNEPYIAVYDLDKPLVLSDLSAGTHTIRAFTSRPWHESFKNEGAYAQTQFHVLTKSEENNPDPNLPVLTYSRPNGIYGAEPIMLDFYLTNAPLHIIGEDNPEDTLSDWRIRCTINGESFVVDRWQKVYLKGFKPGKNWIELEFLDNQGNPVKNVFNSTVRMINYEPDGQDTLSKIVRGEVTADQVGGIVDQGYTTKASIQDSTSISQPEPKVETKVEKTTIPQIPTSSETQPKVETTVEKTTIPQIPTSSETQPKVETTVEKTTIPQIPTSSETQPKVETTVEKTTIPQIPTSSETQPKVETTVEKTTIPQIPTSSEIEPQVENKVEKTTTPETPTSSEIESKVETKVEKITIPEIPTSPSSEMQVESETKESNQKQKVFREFNEDSEIQSLSKLDKSNPIGQKLEQ